jgi:hypothetical protein
MMALYFLPVFAVTAVEQGGAKGVANRLPRNQLKNDAKTRLLNRVVRVGYP